MGLFNSKPANVKPANGINTTSKNMNRGPAPVALSAANSGPMNAAKVNNALKANNAAKANAAVAAPAPQPLMGGRRRKRANQTRRRKSRRGGRR